MPSFLSTQLITMHSKPDFGTTFLLCKDNWAAWTVHRRANICLQFSKIIKTEYRKNPIIQPLSLLLSVPYLSHHQIFSRRERNTREWYSYSGAAVCCIFKAFLQQKTPGWTWISSPQLYIAPKTLWMPGNGVIGILEIKCVYCHSWLFNKAF